MTKTIIIESLLPKKWGRKKGIKNIKPIVYINEI